MSFICLIFFVSSGSLIYFKYFSEIENEKKLYKKLMGVGISHKQIKKMIGKDMIFMFFVPSIMGASIEFLQSLIGYSSLETANLLIASAEFIGVCLFFQVIFYLITKRKVFNEFIGYIKG